MNKQIVPEIETKAQVKQYPLEIENWGGDRYMLVSFGHHDIETFKNKCREEYEHFMYCLDHSINPCPCEQSWYAEADIIPDGYTSYYEPCDEDQEGAIPVTVWWE
ncbi:hypothetical protein NQ658_06965 [Acinetobacter baumannii]|nr:hypothetical protein [Acinetobacter baumannii]